MSVLIFKFSSRVYVFYSEVMCLPTEAVDERSSGKNLVLNISKTKEKLP